jgi:chaperonin cofactor prefoldin
MSNLTLYQIAAEYRQAADTLAELDLDEQTVADTLESIDGDLTIKSQNVAFVIRNLEASAEQIGVAIEAMKARAEALEKRAERVREYLLQNMLMAGVQKIECPYFKLAVRENPPKVIVDDEKQIPMLYMTDPAPPPPPPPKPDKKLIAQALKDGHDVPGCRLERGKRLEIK